jgi:UDP-N-acetylmuramoyl-L-alanyl-D-glutamate--2,6-diaminopimelate ligase
MKLEQLLGNAANPEINAVTLDSRKCNKNTLFITAKDNPFIDDARVRGANIFVCENPRALVAQIAEELAGSPSQDIRIFGVTGTNGKTSTSFFLASMLKAAGMRPAVVGTLGIGDIDHLNYNGFTTPEAEILSPALSQLRKDGFTDVAMEVSSHALALARCDGIRFRGAGFLNLSEDHLDFHGDMESYRKAKERFFFELLPEDGTSVVPHSDPLAQKLRTASKKFLTFGRTPDCDIAVVAKETSRAGTHAHVRIFEKSADLTLPVFGDFNLDNIMCAIGLAAIQGLKDDSIINALGSIRLPPGRLEPIRVRHDAPLAFVDFAHTPDALQKLLQTIRPFARRSVRLVFGCGGDRDRLKRPIMGRIAAQLVDEIWITNDNPRHEDPNQIFDDIFKEIDTSMRSKFKIIPDRVKAISEAIAGAHLDDIVLIAGKGHETTQQIGDSFFPFSDKSVVTEALEDWHK